MLQTGLGSQSTQGSEHYQGRQGQVRVYAGPRPSTTHQPLPHPQVSVEMLQTPGLHYVQLQQTARDRLSAPAPRSDPTSSQSANTTHPVNARRFSPHESTSGQASLHLIGLHSPRRTPSSPVLGAQKQMTRYYQFFLEFAVEPTEIPPQMGVTVLEFDVTHEEIDRLSITSRPPPSPLEDPLIIQLPVSRHFNNSLRFRLRMCTSRKERPTTIHPAVWARGKTYWPPHIFVSVNEEIIHVRRKQHFHHDLPLELTDSVFKGKNKIKVNLPQYPQNVIQDIAYLMAVERIITLDHNSVWDMVTFGPHIGAEVTKKEICRRLRAVDTDEMIIESGVLNVSVVDIFSSTLFNMPVRGHNCPHIECFDLGNWLVSRPSKPSPGPGEPSTVDCWACPICGLDARPCNLQVDDFFLDVAKKLLASGKMNVKKIKVLVDGSWTAIEEGGEGEELSDSESAHQSPPSRVKTQEITPDAME